jgi:uridine kinase
MTWSPSPIQQLPPAKPALSVDCLDGRVKNSKPLVIAVSGMSGAGKSTVVRGLLDTLTTTDGQRAISLSFDDYQKSPTLTEDVLIERLARGGDPDEWRVEQLLTDLDTLLGGQPITAARGVGTLGPADIIVVEEPFGRARSQMRSLVDLALHIQLPANVALARRLLRDFVPNVDDAAPLESGQLGDYLRAYLADLAPAYERVEDLAHASTDVVLDGSVDSAELVTRALAAVEDFRQQPPNRRLGRRQP